MRAPVALSLGGHALVFAALVLVAGKIVPLPEPVRPAIIVEFAPVLPAATPAAAVPPAEAAAAAVPAPAAAPLVAAAEVPALAPETSATAQDLAPPPLPREKPRPSQPPRQAARRSPLRQASLPPAPVTAATPPGPATAALPPAAAVSGSYRAALAAWFERHKRYPEAARERGEQGRVVLRFTVDRDGRVVSHEVAQSSGHPDLDRAVDAMMAGAHLPAFPADMPMRQVDVTITLRFALSE